MLAHRETSPSEKTDEAEFIWFSGAAIACAVNGLAADAPGRWSAEQAKAWYAKQPWLVGSNYNPATASNELEMWQAATFDPKRIDLELGWAEAIGMNTMRVFLHDLLWQQDADGFKKRLDTFLTIASKHHIKPLFVLFDSCWDPAPQLGPQAEPRPGIHNSRWVQSPGAAALDDPSQYPRLEAYVKGVVKAFAKDDRVLGWDVWNEPDNGNGGSYAAGEPTDKTERVLALLPQVFEWAREAGATQPLTSGVWKGGDWSVFEKLSPMEKIQMENSDVISFHNYDKPEVLEQRVKSAASLWAAADLHGVHGARQREHIRRIIADLANGNMLARLIGGWWQAEVRPTFRGIPGSIRTRIASQRSGSTKFFGTMGNHTIKKRRL